MRKFTLQTYGLSVIWTFECFFLSDELANRRSHPAYSHLNGFSPEKMFQNLVFIKVMFTVFTQKVKKITCVSSLMNFQIFAACKVLSATWIWTNEWLFSSVNSDVIDKLVFGFESGTISGTSVPVASVIGIFLISV